MRSLLNEMSADAQVSAALLRYTIAGLGEGVSIFDADLRLVICSERAIELSGIPAQRVKPGVHLRDFLVIQAQAGEFGPCDPEVEADRRIAELYRSPRLTYERKGPNGRTVEVRRSPLPEGGFLTVYLDVTASKRVNEELQAYKFAVDSITDMVSLLDPQQRYLMVNEEWCRATGLKREDVIGRSIAHLLPDVASDERHNAFDRCLSLRERQVVNALVDLPGRGLRDLETTHYPFADGLQAFNGAVLVTRDLTEQRASEARARDSENFIRLVANNVPGMVGYWTRELRCAFANPQYQDWFGLSPREMEGIHLRDLLGEKLFRLNEPHVHAVLRGEDQQFERTLVKSNGDIGYTWAQYIADRKDGEVRGFFVLVSDVTQLKQSQLELERVDETLRIAAIAFEGQEGIVVADAGNVILRVNSAFTRITGFEARDVQGQTLELLRSEHTGVSFFAPILDALLHAGSWEGEVWCGHKLGHDVRVSLAATVVPDSNGRIANYVITLIDITEKHRRAEQRRLDEAAQRHALVREVHHRIKNNLQGITGLLREFACAHPETSPALNRAIGQVNSIATIHGLQGHSNSSALQLSDLVRAIAAQVREIWAIAVEVAFAPGWVDVSLAETESVPLALVLNELLANAAKHSDRACTDVRVELDHDVPALHVRVKIINRGRFFPQAPSALVSGAGLQLVASLMPHAGASLHTVQVQDEVHTLLELSPPVVLLPTSPRSTSPS